MTDDMQRARELLAAEYEKADELFVAQCIRRGVMLTGPEQKAVQAITAALRAAPEGYVLVPVEPTEEMIRAALPHHWPYLGDELKEHWRRMLAARPQEVE